MHLYMSKSTSVCSYILIIMLTSLLFIYDCRLLATVCKILTQSSRRARNNIIIMLLFSYIYTIAIINLQHCYIEQILHTETIRLLICLYPYTHANYEQAHY